MAVYTNPFRSPFMPVAACLLCLAGAAGGHAETSYYALSRVTVPYAGEARSIGGYSGGCLAGGVRIAENGYGYQAMRLSRGRYWMHPELKDYVENYAANIKDKGVWPGILAGDAGRAIGGPMPSGHRSHQSGLDIDIWLTPMPEYTLSQRERETRSAVIHVNNNMDVLPSWTGAHTEAVLTAADDARVARIFINPALKRHICSDTGGEHPALRKLRPWYGHNAHMHVRLHCPEGSPDCVNQAPPPAGDGCFTDDLHWWFSDEARFPKPQKDAKKTPPKKKTLADLPQQCAALLRNARR